MRTPAVREPSSSSLLLCYAIGGCMKYTSVEARHASCSFGRHGITCRHRGSSVRRRRDAPDVALLAALVVLPDGCLRRGCSAPAGDDPQRPLLGAVEIRLIHCRREVWRRDCHLERTVRLETPPFREV